VQRGEAPLPRVWGVHPEGFSPLKLTLKVTKEIRRVKKGVVVEGRSPSQKPSPSPLERGLGGEVKDGGNTFIQFYAAYLLENMLCEQRKVQ